MNLPNYVIADVENQLEPNVLRTMAEKLSFPLSQKDLVDIKMLEQKFDQEQNCAGLAAPQIGIAKQIIIFAAPNDEQLKKWRSDLTQYMEKTIWINPSYEPIDEETFEDYEGCFSVKDLAASVLRYKKIIYHAFDIKGSLITGKAEGFLARVIQHEIDHVHGILFYDRVNKEQLFSIEAYRKKRQASWE